MSALLAQPAVLKCVSLWEPWASAVVIGSKRFETRSWSTKYRGPLLIHAAQRCNKSELIHYHCCWNWCGALAPLGVQMGDDKSLWDVMMFGAVIGSVEVVDCRRTDDMTVGELDTPREPNGEYSDLYRWTERQMGDFSPGRFAWELKNPRRFVKPISFKGHQGFFNVPAEVVADQLAKEGKMNLSAKQRASVITSMKPGDSLTPKAMQDPSMPVVELDVRDLNLPNPLNGDKGHWATRSPQRAEARARVRNHLAGMRVPALPVSVLLCRLGPRKLDAWDGLPASLKGVVDAIAEAYGSMDHDPRFDWLKPTQEKSKSYGVRITITADRRQL